MSTIVVQSGRREIHALKRRKTAEPLLPAARVAHDSRNTQPSRTQTHCSNERDRKDRRLSGRRTSYIIAIFTLYHILRPMWSSVSYYFYPQSPMKLPADLTMRMVEGQPGISKSQKSLFFQSASLPVPADVPAEQKSPVPKPFSWPSMPEVEY